MICGAVSTVTVALTWFWRLGSLPALTNSLRAGHSCIVAIIITESPTCVCKMFALKTAKLCCLA